MTTTTAANQAVTLPLDALEPHPDNVRLDATSNLDDLARSIAVNGVLIPLIVLPADEHGTHRVVAGHRRYHAARKANISEVPCVVRDLTPIEVLDVMLTENEQRSGLSLAESVTAVARYQLLDPAAGATKVAKRIGRTAAWVKQRWALAALPADLVSEAGHSLTLVQLAALAPVAEHADEAVRTCVRAIGNGWRFREDPKAAVENWLARHAAEQALAAKARATPRRRGDGARQLPGVLDGNPAHRRLALAQPDQRAGPGASP